VYEKTVLRRIYGTGEDKGNEQCRIIHNEEPRDLYR
jgi:hypothetical protein